MNFLMEDDMKLSLISNRPLKFMTFGASLLFSGAVAFAANVDDAPDWGTHSLKCDVWTSVQYYDNGAGNAALFSSCVARKSFETTLDKDNDYFHFIDTFTYDNSRCLPEAPAVVRQLDKEVRSELLIGEKDNPTAGSISFDGDKYIVEFTKSVPANRLLSSNLDGAAIEVSTSGASSHPNTGELLANTKVARSVDTLNHAPKGWLLYSTETELRCVLIE